MLSYCERKPTNDTLLKYISKYTYSLGFIDPKADNKYITRALPTFRTKLYFEFYGNISQIKNTNDSKIIEKRTYVGIGIENWFDIYELDLNNKNKIPIKNFKVDLLPHTLFEIFRISPKELFQQDLRIDDIWKDKNDYRMMIEQMEISNNGEEIIKIFERFFLKLLKNKKIQVNSYLPFFLNHNNSLENFSKELGYSRRWVQKEYKELFGLGFKEMNNNIRFLKTIYFIENKIISMENINFSYLASECYYYDQAHLIKDFKKYIGMTPKEYVDFRNKGNILFYW